MKDDQFGVQVRGCDTCQECNCLVDQRSSGQLAVKNVHCFRPGMFEAALV